MFIGTALVVFLIRVLLTAGIVLAVTAIVGRLGPHIGGVVAGLPIVVGPGLAFMALDETPEYLVEASGYVLVSLTATQAFMLAYGRMARTARPAVAVAAAVAAWVVIIAVLSVPRLSPVAAALLFIGAALVSARLLRQAQTVPAPPRAPGGRGSLLLRAVLAGLMVGAITLGSQALGPKLAGLLLAYPVGMTVIAVTIHQRHGRDAAGATLAAAALGTLSIGAFALAVAVLTPSLSKALALAVALGASLLVSLLLLAFRQGRAGSSDMSG